MLGVVISLAVLLAACIPTFITPFQIVNSLFASLEGPQVAVDSAGRRIIVGVNDGRIVFWRTHLGPAEEVITLSAPAEWEQSAPDVAIIDNGTAYIVWDEYNSTLDVHRACQTYIPLTGFFFDTCNQLDPGFDGGGFQKVVARGSIAYAVYDRYDAPNFSSYLYYRQLAGGTQTGLVGGTNGYTILNFNQAIDSVGKLHVTWLQINISGMGITWYNSNATVSGGGDMDQDWILLIGTNATDFFNPPGIALYSSSGTERVGIAYIFYNTLTNEVHMDSCIADGCGDQTFLNLSLPYDNWLISDVNMLGIAATYYISFIGNNTDSFYHQVWYYIGPGAGQFSQISNTDYNKIDLSMVNVDGVPMMSYRRESTTIFQPFIWDAFNYERQVAYWTCQAGTSELYANGQIAAGVWNACGDTWYSTNAYISMLPMTHK